MSLSDGIRRIFGLAQPGGGDSAAVIDAESLLRSPESRRTPSPGEAAALLNRLASFADREKVALTVVLRGSPLREAADGDVFRGVTVRYVDRNSDAAAFISEFLKKKPEGGNPVVVTSDRGIEQAVAASGGQIMQASTFRKALEPAENQAPRRHRQRDKAPQKPAEEQGDTNEKIVNELIDPL